MPQVQTAAQPRRSRPAQQAATARFATESGRRPSLDPLTLAAATLFGDSARDAVLSAVQDFLVNAGAVLDLRSVPASLARARTVGRIGVPQDAAQIMMRQRTVIGANFGGDPRAPVARLWRGLQRRADVLIDARQCTTLPDSEANRSGNVRDVLLISQRFVERNDAHSERDSAQEWTRARDSAELVYRLAAAEQRTVLLVSPVGRGKRGQQQFIEALERQARVQRLPAPRMVKAGLLAALLCGESGSARWLVVSAMPIEELSDLTAEAIGDAGPWPVLSLGRGATFYSLPANTPRPDDPVPMLLVLVSMMQRSGRGALARSLFDAMLVTRAAEARMREELGMELSVPVDAFLRGVTANWGRSLADAAAAHGSAAHPVASALRLRIESALVASAVRQAVNAAVMPAGLEVASVRSVDARGARNQTHHDVIVRSRLGEPPLSDAAALALVGTLGDDLRCIAVEPAVRVAAPVGAQPRILVGA